MLVARSTARLNTAVSNGDQYPWLSVEQNNSVFNFYITSEAGSVKNLYLKKNSASNQIVFEKEIALKQPPMGGFNSKPFIEMGADGNFRIFFTQISGSLSGEIVMMSIDRDGNPVGSPRTLYGGAGTQPSIFDTAVLDDGRIAIVHQGIGTNISTLAPDGAFTLNIAGGAGFEGQVTDSVVTPINFGLGTGPRGIEAFNGSLIAFMLFMDQGAFELIPADRKGTAENVFAFKAEGGKHVVFVTRIYSDPGGSVLVNKELIMLEVTIFTDPYQGPWRPAPTMTNSKSILFANNFQFEPFSVVDVLNLTNGDYVVAYNKINQSSFSETFIQYIRRDGKVLSGDIAVGLPGDAEGNAKLSQSIDGSVVVSYAAKTRPIDNDGWDVFQQKFDVSGWSADRGTNGDDEIIGSASSELIAGLDGKDRLLGWNGNDTLQGGGQADALLGEVGNDALIGDGPVSLTSAAASIRRLYIATLDRGPDDAGWQDWTARRDGGQTLDSIASGFVESAEFKAKYGALDNTQFVTQLYRNVLDREPDAGGLSANVAALNAGQLTRTQIVTGFSESAEFTSGTSPTLHAGQIFRLYGATLARAPDAGGFEGWTDALGSGRGLVGIAAGFVDSAEFKQKYGNTDNTQFVTLLYQNVLGRAPDAGGLASWKNLLDAGTQTRTQVVTGFSESAEYITGTRAGADAFMRIVMTTWSDTLVGGQGNDQLTGGRGSDRYFFTASEGGNDTIYGFESFDTLQLTGFGYANSAAALAAMSQQGGNVVLSYTGGSITFEATQLSTLQSMTAQGWVLA
jgi:Ca2+-binding RTX toxin-like protein